MCRFCNAEIYIKTIQYTAPSLAPLTRAEALRQELLNLTGEVYLRLPNKFCPMCGELKREYEYERTDNK